MEMPVKNTADCSMEESIQVVLGMLDEAIEDYKRGEFISEEELFRELESIK